MSLQELEELDISKLLNACKALFADYPTPALSSRRQRAVQQPDRFYKLEPYLDELARSNSHDAIYDLVATQLSVLRTNLEFVLSLHNAKLPDRSDISSSPQETQRLEWIRQLKGKPLEAFDGIEAIIDRLEEIRGTIQQQSALNQENKTEDRTERGTTSHASSLHSDNTSSESESTVGEGRSLEQDEPKVPEAINMPEEHNPVTANETNGCCDMALNWNNNPSIPSSTRTPQSRKSRQCNYAEAATLHQKTMQPSSQSSSSEHPESLSNVVKSARELFEQRKYRESEKKYRDVLKLHTEALGASSPCIVSIKGNLANALVRQGKHPEAKTIYQEILDLGTDALDEKHPYRLSCRSNLASILEKKGQYGEAEAVYRDVWKLQRKWLGDYHPDTLASYNKLANALTRLKRFGEAVTIYKKALEMRRELLGAEHSDTIITLGNLANALQNQGHDDEAKEEYKEAMRLGEKVLKGGHPHLQWIVDRHKEALKGG
ncbi:hypothetical protein CEP54_010304 [Fusarium duplospermum]|uniref:Uncharacterized protein n=1 Tax=Fusarium duplospermum TaxID=1325734 RepID=A0A428PKL2_9HYPO|nr:hypothetical protein CEP54_010304 [Fusarium duplospermum]